MFASFTQALQDFLGVSPLNSGTQKGVDKPWIVLSEYAQSNCNPDFIEKVISKDECKLQ